MAIIVCVIIIIIYLKILDRSSSDSELMILSFDGY